ncbi:MAG TPA: hypothetical protein VFK41_07900 [Nocardioidaceae bacterium]|nr:hypothetical protein [Nocardioidaceae bacterium]
MSLALVGPGLVPQAAEAATVTVTVVDFEFQNGTVGVAQGTTVTWDFKAFHTATSHQLFWDSGFKDSGDTYSRVFNDAGSFAYFCNVHGHGMNGTIKVRVAASAIPGGKQIRWSRTGGQKYDVQFKRRGAATWRPFRTGVTAASAAFKPAKPGRFVFRARTQNTANAQWSGWSPSKRVRVL